MTNKVFGRSEPFKLESSDFKGISQKNEEWFSSLKRWKPKLSKDLEKLLFTTIEGAMEYGSERDSWGEYNFSDLYNALVDLEVKAGDI